MNCYECGGPHECDHHVIPRSLGGKKTVPLCERCHDIVHDKRHNRRDSLRALASAAIQRKRARGERVGAIPYGSQLAADGVHLLPHEGEQLTIKHAHELRASGLSLRAIAAELSKRGIYTRTGRTFSATQIKRILTPRPILSTTTADNPTPPEP
ncbi:MAG: HNH endonuclease [Planctomycetota bacterium]|jgi:hypothetical protein